ncbi:MULTISPECIES: hypothetical protein [unclassified Solwaraspora]|uniref:hypothetical protein n=1 Tax=unclassified Solwaraspora TaxID=2627926 RepID=UPI00259B853E|nr:hypothetical protein [Solwaraspora sp. WMMA2056]WJK41421.1 hypothetical protein O7608_03015 [Solwaraspora sp. WMMA2056]
MTISSAEEDANPGDNTETIPVTVLGSGPDLVAVGLLPEDGGHFCPGTLSPDQG